LVVCNVNTAWAGEHVDGLARKGVSVCYVILSLCHEREFHNIVTVYML